MVEVELRWADLTAADHRLELLLPAAERRRLNELDRPADRGRRLLGEVLLQEGARSFHGTSEPVAVDRTCDECGQQHGRPTIAGGPYVSVSHSGVLVVVAACRDAPVGVDIEQVSRSGGTDPAAEAQDWVCREARHKTGAASRDPLVTQAVDPPLPGYAAAVAVACDTTVTIAANRSS